MLLDTPICDFGREMPGFVLGDPGGASVAMADAMGERGLLVAFICNHCPYVKAIADRLAADARELAAIGVGVVGVMPNDYRSYPADRPEMMVRFAERHGFGFPYLVDEGGRVAKAWGAVCTPDFFGLNAAGELQYRGRLDDAGRGTAPTRRELVEAMRLIAETGEGPREQVPSMGCSIKWAD